MENIEQILEKIALGVEVAAVSVIILGLVASSPKRSQRHLTHLEQQALNRNRLSARPLGPAESFIREQYLASPGLRNCRRPP